MKYISIIIILIVLLLTFVVYDYITEEFDIVEGIRGGRRRGIRRRPFNRGRRRWYGSNWGYRYRPPLIYYPQYYPDYAPRYAPRYIPWLSTSYWFGSRCKDGCTNIGNNTWGCQYPGNDADDCLFASDCYGCGL